jgi:hypothetical protein
MSGRESSCVPQHQLESVLGSRAETLTCKGNHNEGIVANDSHEFLKEIEVAAAAVRSK